MAWWTPTLALAGRDGLVLLGPWSPVAGMHSRVAFTRRAPGWQRTRFPGTSCRPLIRITGPLSDRQLLAAVRAYVAIGWRLEHAEVGS